MPAQPKILIVENDAALLSSLKFALELQGLAVTGHLSGEAVLADPVATDASCIVLDNSLPGMRGLALLHQLRRSLPEAPAIILASNPTRAVRSAIREVGAMLVEKPLLCDALVAAIRAGQGLQAEAA